MPNSPSPTGSSLPSAAPASSSSSQRTKAPDPKAAVGFLGAVKDARRPSIQFAPSRPDVAFRPGSQRASRPNAPRRMTSPPPPTTYEPRVSFDTFDNRDASDFSFTLKSKHKDYAYTKRSRTFLCGTDQNDYSEFALEWLLDELVDDGDEVVCLRVVDKDSKIKSDASIEEGKYKTEAYKLLENIKSKNRDDEKSINLVLEFAVGKVQESIQLMIKIYEPACLIVGTRGRSLGGIQGLLPGSVSKYCLQNSPVPVIVVRPSAKREKKKRKRLADPGRRAYLDILEQSEVTGSQILDKAERMKLVEGTGGEASEKEARAVAEALGISTTPTSHAESRRESDISAIAEGAPLTRVISARSDYTSGPESPSPTGGLSPDPSIRGGMRSPESDTLDSPELSDEDDDGDVSEGGEDEKTEGR